MNDSSWWHAVAWHDVVCRHEWQFVMTWRGMSSWMTVHGDMPWHVIMNDSSWWHAVAFRHEWQFRVTRRGISSWMTVHGDMPWCVVMDDSSCWHAVVCRHGWQFMVTRYGMSSWMTYLDYYVNAFCGSCQLPRCTCGWNSFTLLQTCTWILRTTIFLIIIVFISFYFPFNLLCTCYMSLFLY